MSLPHPTNDRLSGRVTGHNSNHKVRSGRRYLNHNIRQGSGRNSGLHRYSSFDFRDLGGGYFGPRSSVREENAKSVATWTTFGMGSGIGGGGCNNPTKTNGNDNGGTGGGAGAKGCASSEGSRCVNLDDPQKVFKLVLQAIRHINDGEGATPVEIHCYMRKHHRMPDDEDKLMQIVKDSLKRGICIGCLRRRYCDGKYYISQKSSGRCKRKPPTCVTKDKPPCKKPIKKAALRNKIKKKCLKPKKKCDPKSKAKAKLKSCVKKLKSKKILPKKIKAKCQSKINRQKCLRTKSKSKCKSRTNAKSKSMCSKSSNSMIDSSKKSKYALSPDIWPKFETNTTNKIDQIWENIPTAKW